MKSRMIKLVLFAVKTILILSETKFYSYDGRGNNREHIHWGAAKTPKARLYPNLPYSIQNYDKLPSARRVTEELFHKSIPKHRKESNHLLLEFGHFIVHDISYTLKNTSDLVKIPCDGMIEDFLFCPHFKFQCTGNNESAVKSFHEIDFFRYNHIMKGKISRSSINRQTSFLDLSQIYGTSEKDSMSIRDTKTKYLFLLDEKGHPIRYEHGDLDNEFSLGINKSPGVYCIYIIFMRYHNIRAKTHAETHSDAETIFELARMDTIAAYQNIVEEKYVPILLSHKLPPYKGYNSSVNPTVDEFFSVVSFRYAHSSFSKLVNLLDENWDSTPSDPLLLRDVFENNAHKIVLRHGGIAPFLRGLVSTRGKAVDSSFDEDLNFWADATSTMDVQRSRDMGISSYNDVREALGLDRIKSYAELTQDETILSALKLLYGDDGIELVEAYVGALIEKPESQLDQLGPIFTKSILEQFTRIRDGDRYWYKNRLTPEELSTLPTITEIIEIAALEYNEAISDFPKDSFLTRNSNEKEEGYLGNCAVDSNCISLLGGKMSVAWVLEKEDFFMTLSLREPMEGQGYVGIGWGGETMLNSEIWFCTVQEPIKSLPDNCEDTTYANTSLMSCCVAAGETHLMPNCTAQNDMNYYPIKTLDVCLSNKISSISLRVPICKQEGDIQCFDVFQKLSPENEIEFIAAFNTVDQTRPHGSACRTSGSLNLFSGFYETSLVTNEGLFAVHGIAMLFVWMVCAPTGIFIARYMKTKSWRLSAHISIMTFCGSAMIPFFISAEAAVESGSDDKWSEHHIVGIILVLLYLFMVGAGYLRYCTLNEEKYFSWIGKDGRKFALYFHKYMGLIIFALALWNCYTGLVRISPDDSYFEIIVLNSFPLGYNIPVFGLIKNYLYFPYLAIVLVIFFTAEYRKRRDLKLGLEGNLEGIIKGTSTIWTEEDLQNLGKMPMKTFLELTKHGSQLCVVDGLVIDFGSFVEFHPGGRDLLRFAQGSDITLEFVGQADVGGSKHLHSPSALRTLRSLAIAILENKSTKRDSLKEMLHHSVSPSRRFTWNKESSTKAFYKVRVHSVTLLTPSVNLKEKDKPLILLRLALPDREQFKRFSDSKNLIRRSCHKFPTCTFTFRALHEESGFMIERQYTPIFFDFSEDLGHSYVLKNNRTPLTRERSKGEDIVSFLISLLPNGQMSGILFNVKPGNTLMLQGPKANDIVFHQICKGVQHHKAVVMLAAGTGISPMLQILDYYIDKITENIQGAESEKDDLPTFYLSWLLKNPDFNISEQLGLEKRASIYCGKFQWSIIFGDHGRNSSLSSSLCKKTSAIHTEKIQAKFDDFTGRNNVLSLIRKAKINGDAEICDFVGDKDHFRKECWGESLTASRFISKNFSIELIQEILDSVSTKENMVVESFKEDDLEDGKRHLSSDFNAIRDSLILVSGSPAFESSAIENLKKLGFDRDRIITFT